ncbi:hypothetical protein SAMN04488007_0669 [Maribacter aquivivus]|uniref:Alpha/beta hydrolase family protein n=1 Tax=Maribacter aquivivus TaxID=228958 RepID=A0A1M6K647_9FLAO|nr:hypothetical protein [Maribacter aquivivus]SHJ54399.1 hypothetical protein SAMN04488007_0669 [Maribacter aquivivus]
MKFGLKSLLVLISILAFSSSNGQNIVEEYQKAKNDSLRIGELDSDFLKYIEKGYTLATPENGTNISGVIIFFEGSEFDKKNMSAKQLYTQANKAGYAVLSVSTQIPLDFFFAENSILDAHETIERAFDKNSLPNNNVFLIGVGLSGHRALKYVEYQEKTSPDFALNLSGLVICDAPLDWVRQYNEGNRDRRINYDEGAVWEGSFSNFILEENLNGTPKSNLENYLNFSTYSYSDKTDRKIKYFKNYPVRAYMEVAIEYWLEKKRKTTIDNNGPDMVGLIAQLKLTGNEKSDLVIFYPHESKTEKKNTAATWIAVDKNELMAWIITWSK